MCNEKCIHCMVNALPDGPYMKSATFAKALDFGLLNKLKIFSISGGEPTLHPEFFKLMHFMFTVIKNKEVGVLLESNGWWIEDKKMCERISKLMDHPQVLGMQISTNKKYYPNYEWTMSHREDYEKLHSKIKFTADWQGVDTHLRYMGRGKNILNKDDATGFPNCMNWVSYALNLNNFEFQVTSNVFKLLEKLLLCEAKYVHHTLHMMEEFLSVKATVFRHLSHLMIGLFILHVSCLMKCLRRYLTSFLAISVVHSRICHRKCVISSITFVNSLVYRENLKKHG